MVAQAPNLVVQPLETAIIRSIEVKEGQLIHAGDVLTAVTKVTDVYEKTGGRGGTMTFVVMDTEFTNQKGEKVAISRGVTIETGQVVAR